MAKYQLESVLTGIGNGNGLNFSFEAKRTPSKSGINVFFFNFFACTGVGAKNIDAATKQAKMKAKQ